MKKIILLVFLLLVPSVAHAKEWVVQSTQPENIRSMMTQEIEGEQIYLIDTLLAKTDIQAIPGVIHVEENVAVSLPKTTAFPRQILADPIPLQTDFPRGDKPVKVAVLDTGVNPFALGLLPYLEEGFSVIPAEDVTDVNGHGTEVTHIIADGAPTNVRIVPIKIMNRVGRGSVYTVVDGLYKAKELGVSMVNLSFGAVVTSNTLYKAIQAIDEAGITIVAAVGNLGGIGAFYPARYNEVIGVGAHDEQGMIAPFSQTGEGVDLFVRGTAMPTKSLQDAQVTKNGTSFASAYVVKQLAYYETLGLPERPHWKTWLQPFVDEQQRLQPSTAHLAILKERPFLYHSWPKLEKAASEPVHVHLTNEVMASSLHLGSIFAIANNELVPLQTEIKDQTLIIRPDRPWPEETTIYITPTMQSVTKQTLREAISVTIIKKDTPS